MHSRQYHPLSTRDLHVPSWYPIQSSPSQDMWELPSHGTPTSFLDSNNERGFSPQIEDEGIHDEHGMSELYMESSMDAGTRNGSIGTTAGVEKRLVLCDATNTVQRLRNNSPTTNRTLRRSRFN